MSSKYLTDATFSADFYTSKIVFFTNFRCVFHLGGVLGFWDCSFKFSIELMQGITN